MLIINCFENTQKIRIAQKIRILPVVIHIGGEAQREPWLDFLPEAVKTFEYPIKCLTHEKCPGLGYTGGVKVTLTNGTQVPYELQEAVEAMCEELFGQKARVRAMAGPVEDPVYLEAKEEPGIHFRELPALATIKGRIVALDAGTKEGGGVDAERGGVEEAVRAAAGLVYSNTTAPHNQNEDG